MLMRYLLLLLPVAVPVLGDQACIAYPQPKHLDTITACPKTHIIDIRGTGEPQGPAAQRCIVDELVARLPQTDACALNYDAKGGFRDPKGYAESEDRGVDQLNRYLIDLKKSCPQTGIVLMGYSQGAHVVGDSLCGRAQKGLNFKKRKPLKPEYFDNVKAIIQFGDPSNLANANVPWHVGSGKGPGIFYQYRNISECRYMEKRNIWRSYCSKSDIFCDTNIIRRMCPHLEYLRYDGDEVLRYVMHKVTGKDPGSVNTKCPCPNPKKIKCNCKSKSSVTELEDGMFDPMDQTPLELR